MGRLPPPAIYKYKFDVITDKYINIGEDDDDEKEEDDDDILGNQWILVNGNVVFAPKEADVFKIIQNKFDKGFKNPTLFLRDLFVY